MLVVQMEGKTLEHGGSFGQLMRPVGHKSANEVQKVTCSCPAIVVPDGYRASRKIRRQARPAQVKVHERAGITSYNRMQSKVRQLD